MIVPDKKIIVFGITAVGLLVVGLLFNPVIFLAVLVGAVVVVWFTRYPEAGLYIVIILLPFTGWLMNFGTIGIVPLQFVNTVEMPPVDFAAAILFIAFIIRQLVLLLTHADTAPLRFPLIKSFLLFFGVVLASSLLSNAWAQSVWYAVRWILFFYAAYIWLPVNIIRSERVLKQAIACLVIAGSLVAAIGLASLFTQDWTNELVRVKPLGWYGVYPLTNNHNVLAEGLVAALFFAVAWRYWPGSPERERLVWLVVGGMAVILLGTFSRAAWLAFLFQIIMYGIFKYKQSGRKFITDAHLLIAVLVAAILMTVAATYLLRVQTSRVGQSSTNTRIILTQIAWEAFLEKPLLGHGSGRYMDILQRNIRYSAQYNGPLESHGVWQKLLAENGLAGVAAFVVFSLSFLAVFYRALRLYRFAWPLLVPLIAGSLGMYLFQFFNTSYYKGKLWMPVAITLAAIYLVQRKHGEGLYGKK